MKKCLFILSFMLLVMFSEKECKGPDGDSKPTPFRKETEMIYNKKYSLDAEGIFYSIICVCVRKIKYLVLYFLYF